MIISWNVTKRCNLKCKHCYRDAGKAAYDELTTTEGKELLQEIAHAGFKIIIFSGGEALLRQDIYELIRTARQLKLRPVLGTNATLLDDKKAIKLKEAGLARAGISLDSFDASVHDKFRQKSGSWEKTMAAIASCQHNQLDFQIHTTVTQWNQHQIEKMIDFVSDLGARAFHIFFLVPTGRGENISDAAIDTLQYRRLLNVIIEKQKTASMEIKPVCAPQFVPLADMAHLDSRFQRGCLAGTGYCCILPDGDVHPCPYLPVHIGNVRRVPFSKLWNSHPIFSWLRSIDYTGRCGKCQFKQSCGGCRARAFHQTGDYMSEDPNCFCFSRAKEKTNAAGV